MLMFVGARIKHLPASRTDAFDLRGIMHGKPRSFVEIAGVSKYVSAACLIDVKTNQLPADRTLGYQRVTTPAAEQLDEFNSPYGEVPHARPLTVEVTQTPLYV